MRLTGERPVEGATPDSLLALHEAGYLALRERLGAGDVLDVGCGLGYDTVDLFADGRRVFGVDYDPPTAATARDRFRAQGFRTAAMDGSRLGLRGRRFDWVTSSHLIEHFPDPGAHAAELARVLKADGTAFVITPNEPADFENPYHISLLGAKDLQALLERSFADVTVQGLDATPAVKADFEARRASARKVLRLDVFDLRHKIPRKWYIALYARALPLAYRVLSRKQSGGDSGITAADFFVTDDIDDTTLVLLATCRQPR
jgi:SAM-dependent methyltransferase